MPIWTDRDVRPRFRPFLAAVAVAALWIGGLGAQPPADILLVGGLVYDGSGQPTAAELDTMRALVRKGMREGAFGLSTGLFYVPGYYATTEEVIELARRCWRSGAGPRSSCSPTRGPS